MRVIITTIVILISFHVKGQYSIKYITKTGAGYYDTLWNKVGVWDTNYVRRGGVIVPMGINKDRVFYNTDYISGLSRYITTDSLDNIRTLLSGKQPVGSYITTANIAGKVNATDTSAMLANYLRTNIAAATYQPLLGFTPYNATNPSGYISAVPAQTFASLTGKPTTLSGYGITDGLTVATAAATYQPVGTYVTGTGTASGTNTGDNAANTTYTSDYRAANFIAGTNYLAPNGSAAALTNFPLFDKLGTVGTGVWNATPISSLYLNAENVSITANSAAINTTETVILKTAALPANRLVAGTTIRITLMGTCTSSAANVSTFAIRIGTLGTTADGLIASAATPIAAVTGTTIPFKVVWEIVVRTTGASATSHSYCTLLNTGITGITTSSTGNIIILPTFTNFNTTTANNIISATYKSAAATTTCIFQNAIIEFINK